MKGSELPINAITAWAEEVVFIRDNGQQVSYSERAIPELRQRHDDMLRELLAWHRSHKNGDAP